MFGKLQDVVSSLFDDQSRKLNNLSLWREELTQVGHDSKAQIKALHDQQLALRNLISKEQEGKRRLQTLEGNTRRMEDLLEQRKS